jgi:hypothetical protein
MNGLLEGPMAWRSGFTEEEASDGNIRSMIHDGKEKMTACVQIPLLISILKRAIRPYVD